ncbi:MAG: Diacylglycerol kinase [Candidatus Magasanikbacteria bacterium GW2011_GWA2_50_22]|uniref:Diacylglycerol kinase n=1 Tax=Candidatus Magasanikbacteria bacterium GW2011_GWA2_50_22 TaxID=1619043 RepID=A0A0G1ZDW3_9BACT|nr:MAG: Diacylglycerol kinase [Candidatus Magasanikbacteria bacterium GW2011_GWA2_50_22]
MLSLRRLFKSFHYASRGIAIAWQYEQSFRVQVFAALAVIFLIFWFKVLLWQAVALLLLIILVLTLELINSILERFIDVLKPRIHPMVEEIKDLMAGAVLIASLGALIVGLLILSPYLLQ